MERNINSRKSEVKIYYQKKVCYYIYIHIKNKIK